jgi:hypothetical protein
VQKTGPMGWMLVAIVLLGLAETLIAAQSAAFSRGDHVRVRIQNTPSEPKQVGVPLMVVAVPHDRIRFDGHQLYVNDVRLTGFSKEFISRVGHSKHTPRIVPDGQYLVMGEFRQDDVTDVWGIHPVESLEPANLQSSGFRRTN